MPVKQAELRALLDPVVSECRAHAFDTWRDWVRHARLERRDARTTSGDAVRIEIFAHWVDDATQRIQAVVSADHEGAQPCVPASETFIVTREA